MKKALFPGSFDPVTRGHVDIVDRGLALFDEVIVALGENSQKKYMFSIEERLEMLRLAFQDKPRVKVTSYDVLTVDFAKEIGAKFLLRGIRGRTRHHSRRRSRRRFGPRRRSCHDGTPR